MLPFFATATLISVTGADVQARMDADLAAGRPLVAHVHVALADNLNQGIAPTTPTLGDGQNPRTNLYWGALYGVRTYLPKRAGWRLVGKAKAPDGVLERLVFTKKLRRRGKRVRVYVVADAWDGRLIEQTTRAFLAATAGLAVERVKVGKTEVLAGGAAHLVAYVGHNGLMEFEVAEPAADAKSQAKSAVVLACASKNYFQPKLERVGAHPLLLTTHLMAPEAYTLDAAFETWFAAKSSTAVHAAAARAYTKYQKAPLQLGQRLFWSAP